MENEQGFPDETKPSPMRTRVRALLDSIDGVLSDEEAELPADGVADLTPEEEGFVEQFSSPEVVERMLSDRVQRKARRKRLHQVARELGLTDSSQPVIEPVNPTHVDELLSDTESEA